MLNKSNIIKAVILSFISALVAISIQIFSATEIHSFKDDIDWETVNAMPYQEASRYLEENSQTSSGIEVLLEHIMDPVLWYGSVVSILISACGFFVSFMVLLFWVGQKKYPNNALKIDAQKTRAL